ncbi:Mg-chelatase subunit ChlD [Terriglobus roseus DSM 18391]|uniref:Mg-chelatase subunit ChlD n=1 Tax=Terriglobus roseus (strain DSM 18391 / NRRL B-41598 / KBS 63) TaxID=926566 RepID=I3ZJM8_TERRK|nr:VWA domain-containing protein [Terriglobus roseus]AFL89446.1 Mg-chelatase subunit ChlD [Terriglobus roseus DSM 18391]
MNRFVITAASVLAICSALPAASRAQQAGQDSAPILRVETRLVNVPVNVVDGHGVAVGGLSQDDFTVMEDGRTQKIAIFEREASTPLSIVMAVDTSGSVFSQFKTERAAAKRFAEQILRPEDEMDLIAFSYDSQELVPYTNDARRIDEGIKRLTKGDDTALYDAVYVASERLTESKADATRRRVLVLVTDGGDNTSRKEIGYAKAVAEAQRAGAAIYPIIIVPILADAGRNVGGEHALIQMAEDTGGKYFYVTEKEDLKAAFAHLSDDLRTQYLLGYYAPRRGVDASFRKINVSLKDPAKSASLALRSRTGYYADAR